MKCRSISGVFLEQAFATYILVGVGTSRRVFIVSTSCHALREPAGLARRTRGRQVFGTADTGSRPVRLSSRNDRLDVTLITPGRFLSTVSTNRL